MGSGGMIYIPSFMKIGSGVQNLLGGDIHADANSKTITLAYCYSLKVSKAG
jgi:hypothetical protein